MRGGISQEPRRRTRSDDPDEFSVDDERQQPGPGCFHELMVIKRAGLGPAVHEGFEFKPKPPGQRMDILVFIDDAGGDEHAISADAGFAGALLHLADNVKGQAVTNAVELGNNMTIDGPIVGSSIVLGNNLATNAFPTITQVPAGMPSNPAVYAQSNPPQMFAG